jgi:hypothetical protein
MNVCPAEQGCLTNNLFQGAAHLRLPAESGRDDYEKCSSPHETYYELWVPYCRLKGNPGQTNGQKKQK